MSGWCGKCIADIRWSRFGRWRGAKELGKLHQLPGGFLKRHSDQISAGFHELFAIGRHFGAQPPPADENLQFWQALPQPLA